MPIITLTTDFGTRDTYVGQMKGVILAVAPVARIVDITHEIPPQDIVAGALAIESALDAFPKGTVHVGVVDPGVGTARNAIAVKTPDALFVGPDNGLLTAALAHANQWEAVALTNASLHREPVSATFHGRDIFAPAAAHLAMGTALAKLGESVDTLQKLDLPEPEPEPEPEGDGLALRVLSVDRFGNLITNLTRRQFDDWRAQSGAPKATLSVAGETIGTVSTTFADVEPGRLVAYFGSGGRLEVAVRNGDAASRLGAGRDTVVRVR